MTAIEMAELAEIRVAAVILASNFIDRMQIKDPGMKLEQSLVEYAVKHHHTWTNFEPGSDDRRDA